MIRLVPVEGKRVRDPVSKKLLDSAGIRIEALNTFWFRRLKDGDVVEAPMEVVEKSAAKKEKLKEGEK